MKCEMHKRVFLGAICTNEASQVIDDLNLCPRCAKAYTKFIEELQPTDTELMHRALEALSVEADATVNRLNDLAESIRTIQGQVATESGRLKKLRKELADAEVKARNSLLRPDANDANDDEDIPYDEHSERY